MVLGTFTDQIDSYHILFLFFLLLLLIRLLQYHFIFIVLTALTEQIESNTYFIVKIFRVKKSENSQNE